MRIDDPNVNLPRMPEFEAGLLLGLFIGEIHFGGDRSQPHATLKMHEREKPLFDWIRQRLPSGKLYGPYTYMHKDGIKRTSYQLMFRGTGLRNQLIPFLDYYDWEAISPAIYARYRKMKEKYAAKLGLSEPD